MTRAMADLPDDAVSFRGKVAGLTGIGFGLAATFGINGLMQWLCLCGAVCLVWGVVRLGPAEMARLLVKAVMDSWPLWTAMVIFAAWLSASVAWTTAGPLGLKTAQGIWASIATLPLAAWAVASPRPADQSVAQRGIIAGAGLALFVLMIESLGSTAPINQLTRPGKDFLAIQGDLGRSASATLTVAGVALLCLARQKAGQLAMVFFALVAFVVSTRFGTDLNLVGVCVSVLAAGFAWVMPRVTLVGIGTLGAAVIALGPKLYATAAALAQNISDGDLPLSYARRVQMWEAAVGLIGKDPLKGQGLGAATGFNAPLEYGGFPWTLLQRHPHSAPLHIWLETGMVGALLAAVLTLTAGFAAARAFGRDRLAAAALMAGLTHVALNWGLSHSAWREWVWAALIALVAYALAARKTAPQTAP